MQDDYRLPLYSLYSKRNTCEHLLEHKSFATRKNMGMDEKDLIIYTERKIVA
jgi:hypothetical protein